MEFSIPNSAVSVSEVHAYPPRPEGFEEPLFPTADSKRAVAEHLLRAPWLARASEVEGSGGEAAHARGEPVGIEASDGRAYVRRPACGRRARRERVVEVLDSWREVGGWWGEGGVDRLVVRVLLSGGAVIDLARERSGWVLAGIND